MKDCTEKVAACPECLSGLRMLQDHGSCVQCGVKYPLRDSVIFFSEVPRDIVPDGIDYAKDKAAWSPFKKRNYDFIEKAVRELHDKSIVLDVGAGPGFFKDIFDRFTNYMTVDFYNYPGIDLVSNFVEQRIPIRSSAVDGVILSNVLEHISKPEKLLLECRRILRNGGKLIIIVPFLFKIHQEPYDYYRYTHYKLREMLEECGFQNIEIKKMGTIVEVLNGMKYELKTLMLANTKHQFVLKQLLRLQYYIDIIIKNMFLRFNEEELTNQDIFAGYSCLAVKS